MLPDESNKVVFSDTGKRNVLLPGEINQITFSDTGKQNVLLPDKSNKIMFSDTGTQDNFASCREQWAIPENMHNTPMDDTELGT